MENDEIDFEQAKPVKVAQEVSPEKTVAFFSGDVVSPLHPKELTEEILARLYDNMQEADHLAKLIEMDKRDVKELCRGMETVQKGKFVAILKTVNGRKTVNWQKLVKDMIKNVSDEELAKYTDEGDPSVRLEIKKLS